MGVNLPATDGFRKRAIFLDVDGTLMDHEIVDPYAPEAIAQARANGHLVFVCTGRSFNGLDPAMEVIEFDGMVTSAGAAARVGEVLVHHLPMELSATKRLIDFFTKHHILYILESDDGVYCSEQVRQLFETFWVERIKQHQAELQAMGLPVDTSERDRFSHFLPLEAANLETVNKATFISVNADSYDQAIADLGPEYHFVPGSIPLAGGSSGEIGAAGITKATGIAAILEYLGMDAADAVGIGDSWNDAEMFELCGVAVAMGNAAPELQSLADFTTTKVLQGGIRDAFVRLGII